MCVHGGVDSGSVGLLVLVNVAVFLRRLHVGTVSLVVDKAGIFYFFIVTFFVLLHESRVGLFFVGRAKIVHCWPDGLGVIIVGLWTDRRLSLRLNGSVTLHVLLDLLLHYRSLGKVGHC